MSLTLSTPDLSTHQPFSAEKRAEIARFWDENGYYVLENALSMPEVEQLRAETARICAGEAGEIRGANPRIEGQSDDEVLRQYLCIHFPHKISRYRRCFDERNWPRCQGNAVDAFY
jgi:hypothetical protein